MDNIFILNNIFNKLKKYTSIANIFFITFILGSINISNDDLLFGYGKADKITPIV